MNLLKKRLIRLRLLIWCILGMSAAGMMAETRPNIIYIMADDLG